MKIDFLNYLASNSHKHGRILQLMGQLEQDRALKALQKASESAGPNSEFVSLRFTQRLFTAHLEFDRVLTELFGHEFTQIWLNF